MPAELGQKILKISESPEATGELGRQLGAACRGGEVLLLKGELGAGKTRFTQGLALGLGVPENERVTSPTFVLHCQYRGRLELNHIDLYRLGGEPPELGLGDLFGAAGGVAVVEWAEFLGRQTPRAHLSVEFRIGAGARRELEFSPAGAVHAELLRRALA